MSHGLPALPHTGIARARRVGLGVLVLRKSGEAVNGWDVSVDDMPSALNELQARDLETILTMTPERRRVEVALAFVGWEVPTWATAAGLQHVTVWRWLRRENRLPLGGAVRLARVLGIDPLLLFQGYL